MENIPVLIKGAGDLASGVAHRLHRCGFVPVLTELPRPLVVRRTVAFAEAVYSGEITVEGVRAARADCLDDIERLRAQDIIAVVIDPAADLVRTLRPAVLVDAIMAKYNTGTRITDAPAVIALGPGFCAGRDAHAVIETKRGHDQGSVIWGGAALPDTGEPGEVNGFTHERVLRSPADGLFVACHQIGDQIRTREVVAFVGEHPVRAEVSGVLRGLLRDENHVKKGLKIGDIDPRAQPAHCHTISDKARAIAGGVLEAIFNLLFRKKVLGDLFNVDVRA